MEGVHIDRVARPFEPLAVRLDHEAGEAVDAADGGVAARHPLRIEQGERTAHDRDRFLCPKDVARDVAGIDSEADHARVGPVLRSGDLGRQKGRCLRRHGAAE